MNDRSDLHDLLNRDIDRLLQQRDRHPNEPQPAEYEETLAIARDLADLDFDPQQRAQRSLWPRIAGATTAPHRRPWPSLRPRRALRAYLPLLIPCLALLLIVSSALAWPGALTAVARTWETSVQRLILREPLHTRILAVPERITPMRDLLDRQLGLQSVVLLPKTEPPITFSTSADETWSVRTSIGEFRGFAQAGHDSHVRRFMTLADTRAAVDYGIKTPKYLPTGYGFREGVVTPARAIYMVYGGPHEDIVMVQVAIEQDQDRPMAALTTMTDQPIMRVAVGHQPGNWIAGHGLIWELDEAAMLVGGRSLDLDEATRIAVSFR